MIYAGTVLKIPVIITNADQSPAPPQTIPCDFSHSPGVARITGTATTIAKETNIRIRTNTFKIPTILSFDPLRINLNIIRYYKQKTCKKSPLKIVYNTF